MSPRAAGERFPWQDRTPRGERFTGRLAGRVCLDHRDRLPGDVAMNVQTSDVSDRVKRIIFNVSRIPVERIGDASSFREDLELDSLSLMEIGVDLDYEFKLQLEDLEQRLADLPTVESVVCFIEERLEQRKTA
jgi:acyl carrier protein